MPSQIQIDEIIEIMPEWRPVRDSVKASLNREPQAHELFERLGAKALINAAVQLGKKDDKAGQFYIKQLRDHYYQPLIARMLNSNQNLKRFFIQRHMAADWQKDQTLSMSQDLAVKMEGVLKKHLASGTEDGFKVLLPAYIQRTVHNAVVDHVKSEWQWEKETLQDLSLDPDMEDPRSLASADREQIPENQMLSREQVTELNKLRRELEAMLREPGVVREPLMVVDLMFGLGLTPKSKLGQELTMREVTVALDLPGETQARKIARCQVLLDKGLDMIRQRVRAKMPEVASSWQADINVNTASRRELTHQLNLTEGEVDRLIAERQYYSMQELIDKGVIKLAKLQSIVSNGAVAAFVPVEINSCTTRDMIDILGFTKDAAQKITASRPFADLKSFTSYIVGNNLAKTIDAAIERGLVVKPPISAQTGKKVDVNQAPVEQLLALGIDAGSAQLILRGRPFATWSELEDFVSLDEASWQKLRQNACLMA